MPIARGGVPQLRKPVLSDRVLKTGLLVMGAVVGLPLANAHAACSPAGNGTDQTITCNGTINAPFGAGGGADTLNVQDGTVFQAGADVDGENGADTFNFEAGTITIDAGAILDGGNGADTFNFLAGTLVFNSGTVRGSDNADTFSIFGTLVNVGTLAGNDGADQFSITGFLVNFGDLNTNNGADNITVAGGLANVGTVAMGDGADTLTIEAPGVFNNIGVLNTGANADVLSVAGQLFNFDTIRTADGGDQILVSGTVINFGLIDTDDGGDEVNVSAGGTFTNSGTLRTENGQDLIDVAGTFTNSGDLLLGDADDTLAVTGFFSNSGLVNLQGNDDAITVSAGATFVNSGAIEGGGGADTVTIGGLFAGAGGTIDLEGGPNAIGVLGGGIFETGAMVGLGGPANTLTNAGTLSPGGSGAIATTAIDGTLVQTATGILAVDVGGNAATGPNDRINVTGAANIAGTVAVNLLAPTSVSQQFTLVSAAAGLTQTAVLDGVAGSPVVTYELSSTATDLILGVTLDYTAPGVGLNANQLAIATHLNAVLAAGGGGLQELLAALSRVPSAAGYISALDQLSPELFLSTQSSALQASLGFSSGLLSCKANGPDAASINREGQCLWISARAQDYEQDGTRQQLGFDERAGQFAGGGQIALDGNWRLGFGLGYQNSSLSNDAGAGSDGDLLMAGVALKYSSGPLLLAAAASGGRGWYDTTRPLNFGGLTAVADGEQDIDVLAGRLHASYVFGAPALYFKPLVNLNVTHTDMGNLTETGAGAVGLRVNGQDETVFSISPALEVGTEWWWENGTLVRPYVRAGVTWFDDPTAVLSASFVGSPAGIGDFTIRSETDDTLFDISAGLDVVNAGDTALRFSYDGHFGDNTAIHAVGVKGSVPF